MSEQPTVVEVEEVPMRIILLLTALLGACTSKNPLLCCVDEADCAGVGLDEIKGCDDGLVCRGNQCIAQVCEGSAECDAAAPYCIAPPDGRCQEACSDDSQCPGFGQSSDLAFCEGGSCVACRTNANCESVTPVCDQGACRACVEHAECGSGVCGSDGACVAETEIAYVAPGGSASSDCTRATPCTLTHGLDLLPTREFLLLGPGTYQQSGPTTINGRRSLIGEGATRPAIQNILSGPIIKLAFGADLTIDNLEIFGATTGANGDGHGIDMGSSGSQSAFIRRSVLRNNQRAGIRGSGTRVDAVETTFSGNQEDGVVLISSRGTFDRCVSTGNTNLGLFLDAGIYEVRNTFVTRNGKGVDIFPSDPGNVFEFNTIVDNAGFGVGCTAAADTPEAPFPNNLIARNGINTSGQPVCTYPNAIITTDVATLNFVSPNAVPFDYHITAGSIAVGAAGTTTLDHDFDGDARPATGADVGADQL